MSEAKLKHDATLLQLTTHTKWHVYFFFKNNTSSLSEHHHHLSLICFLIKLHTSHPTTTPFISNFFNTSQPLLWFFPQRKGTFFVHWPSKNAPKLTSTPTTPGWSKVRCREEKSSHWPQPTSQLIFLQPIPKARFTTITTTPTIAYAPYTKVYL